MAKIQAFADNSGQITVKVTDLTTSGVGLNIRQKDDPADIFIDGPYVEAFIRKLRKMARKAGVYSAKPSVVNRGGRSYVDISQAREVIVDGKCIKSNYRDCSHD